MTVTQRFLGVDGGGTKTRFVLIDGGGAVLAECRLGATYHPEAGLDGVRDIFADGVARVCAQQGIAADAIDHAFFGIPAYGEDSRVMPLLHAMAGESLGHARYDCDNDMVCGWAGSMACGDGINMVAGTGSIGYGQRRGVTARAGGWGEVFSDEGSAYWIAIQGLNAYARMSDGRLPRGALHAIINAELALEHDLDLCARIYGDRALERSELARLSLLVAGAARMGDAAALDIYARAGRELAAICDALRRSLGFAGDEAVPLSYSGGAFSAGDLLLAPFRDALHAACPHFELREPVHEPHYGAAMYAARLWQAASAASAA